MATEEEAKAPTRGRKKGQRYYRTVRSVRAYVGNLLIEMKDHHVAGNFEEASKMVWAAKVMADIITKTDLEKRIEALERRAVQPIQPTTQQEAVPH